jgi:hypothetical protein
MRDRLRLEGDHSYYHGGSAAVMSALRRIASDKGWHIVKPGEDFDVMVMNGEGTMHHGWEGCRKKISIMRHAADAGKEVHLVNTVWQENPNEFDDLLRGLASISVREVRSQADLRDRHGIKAAVIPDVSMYAPVSQSVFLPRNFRGEPAVTDFYWPGENKFERGDKLFPQARYLRFKKISWHRAIASMKTASYIITGRQHAVFAACKARVPFAASEGNTHKIRGLIESAGAEIPVANSPEQIRDIIPMISELRGEYDKLFDWLECQDYPSLIPSAAPTSKPQGAAGNFTLR